MEMPEGWKKVDRAIYKVDLGSESLDALITSLDMMKEMAEALEKVAVIYYSKEEGLNKTEWLRKDSIFEALDTLKKFKEWK